MKRFYDAVDVRQVDAGWQVTLDGRGLKTVKGSPQIVPTRQLADFLAAEWDIQGEELDSKKFPFRDMTDYAVDIVGADTESMAAKLVAYGDTDTLLYRADPDEHLYARQQEVWEPIVTAFEAREDIVLTRISGVMHRPQSKHALAALRARLAEANAFELAGIEVMTSLSASLTIALSSIQTPDLEEATRMWCAASLEEEWQANLWGRDGEAEELRRKRQNEFLGAWSFVRAAKA